MTHLTAIVLTHNEAEQIADCIKLLRFADRIIVFDSFSTDETVSIAQRLGADIYQHEFENYAEQRNAALDAADEMTDWVLFVDADERITDVLAEEIRQKILLPEYAGWRLPRHNYIFGVLTKGAGWYPDYQTRLLRVGQAQYDRERTVHEVVKLYGAEGTLRNPIIHYNYRDICPFQRQTGELRALRSAEFARAGDPSTAAQLYSAAAAAVLLAICHLGRIP